MARISTYSIDPNITADDKWIGTDFNTQYTKNFTPQYLADFFNVSNSIGVSGQVSFKYYSTFPSGRPEESITTPAVNPNFSAVTSFKIHKNSGGGNYCIDFINYLSGDEILISDTSNADIFGHFKLNSVTQDLSETNFYNLNVTYIGGNGNLQHLKVYSIALYSATVSIPTVGTWGALNYPTWTTGTPFVKMTAAGTFALDTNTYVTTANATLQNAYNNSTDGKIILDLTRGAVKFQAITGTTNTIESYHSGGGLVFTVSNVGNVVGQYIYANWFNAPFNAGLQDNSGTVQFKSQYDGIAGQGRWESNQRINYLADYSALYSNRSLIDKGYADTTYVPKTRTLTINGTSYDLSADRSWTIAAGVTSVGLTMPSAFSVTNSPITSSGNIAVSGAGSVSQYVRGDGTLANFPNSTGGGSSVNYYLNGSVSQGTFGGDTYYQMSKTPILGAGTNFTRTNGAGNGYIASFITDAGDPSFLNIPGGNWNVEFYFQSSASGGSPQFYGEIYKVSATNVFTLVASGSANPEGITNGTTIDQYFTSIPVPQTSLLITDRLAIRIYVITGGRTITLHTENGNLCEVLTTFTTGLTALNGLTQQVQNLAVGTSGTDFAISSATATHTFNLPTASATNRGALSSTDWSIFNSKQSGKSINTVSVNTSAGSASSTDYVYLASGTINITLPTAVGNQNLYTIKNVGTGVITIDTTSSQTIDGSLTAPIRVQYLSLTIISDGANWNII